MAIKYIQYNLPQSKIEEKLTMEASMLKVEGDFLTGPLTLWDAKYYLDSVLYTFNQKESRMKLHNNVAVKMTSNSVWLEIKGAQTGDKRKLVGFENE